MSYDLPRTVPFFPACCSAPITNAPHAWYLFPLSLCFSPTLKNNSLNSLVSTHSFSLYSMRMFHASILGNRLSWFTGGTDDGAQNVTDSGCTSENAQIHWAAVSTLLHNWTGFLTAPFATAGIIRFIHRKDTRIHVENELVCRNMMIYQKYGWLYDVTH